MYCGLIVDELALISKIGVDWTVVPMAFGIPQMAACFPRNKNGNELLFMHSYVVREFDRLIHGAEADNTKGPRPDDTSVINSTLGLVWTKRAQSGANH